MIHHLVAIEKLMAQASRRVELNNAQSFRARISLADTVEAKAAELISHSQHRIDELVRELKLARGRLQAIHDDIGHDLVPLTDSLTAAMSRIDSVLGRVVA